MKKFSRLLSVVAVVFLALTPAAAAASEVVGASLTRGLDLIDRAYLFDSKLDPPELLDAALEYLERKYPEVISRRAGDRAFLVEADPCRMRIELPPAIESVGELAPWLERTARIIQRCTTKPKKDAPPLESILLRAVLSGLDRYSTVFDAERRTEHSIQFRGKLAGIGARIGIRNEKLTLITVYRESPAYRAGLRDGDVVRRIDDVSTTNMLVSEAVHRIRGDAGTQVRLTIERPGEPDLLPIVVTRDIVVIPSVKAQRVGTDIVYAEISHFSQTTPDDFRRRVSALLDEGPVRGVIIDLRHNSGGSMLGSAAIGDLFLSEGVLITTAGRHGEPIGGLTAQIRATEDTPFADLPVVFLTSPHTASGSELLAGSLRNNDRAVLAGERTFGKGTVQKTYGLGNGSALKLTVGNFLPNGRAIPGGGMIPDVEVDRYVITDGRVRLPASHAGKELPFWLQTPAWLQASHRKALVVIPQVEEIGDDDKEPADVQVERDPLVNLAADLLRGYGSTSAARMLALASGWLAERKMEAEQAAAQVLVRHGVDWRGAPGAAAPVSVDQLEVSVTADGDVIKAGEETKITVSVRNSGSTPVYRLRGKLAADSGILDGRGLLFGYLAPGGRHTWTTVVKPPRALHTSRLPVRVEFYDDHGLIGRSKPTALVIEEISRPRLLYRMHVRAGEEPGVLRVTLDLANRGAVAANDVRVALRHPKSNEVEILQGTATLEHLAGGSTETIELSVKMLVTPTETPIVEGTISESDYGIFETVKIPLEPTDRPGRWRGPPEISIAGVTRADDGRRRLVFRIRDESGLVWALSRVGDDQVGYERLSPGLTTEYTVRVPWTPKEGESQRIVVRAADRDGMQTVFSTDL